MTEVILQQQNDSYSGDFQQTDLVMGGHHIGILSATVAGSLSKPNEDAYSIVKADGRLVAGMFDGTTNHIPIKSLVNETGAHFASHYLKDILPGQKLDGKPKKILINLNNDLREEGLKLAGVTLNDIHTLPSSTGTLVVVDSGLGTLDFAHVGDSGLIAYFVDGTSAVLTNDRHRSFDVSVYKLAERIAKEKGISNKEALKDPLVLEDAIKMYIRRNNNPNGEGSGLVNGDPNMDMYVQEGSIPLKNLTSALIYSDGLIPIEWSLSEEGDRQKILETVLQKGLSGLIDIKRTQEAADPDWKIIRSKDSDDGSGIFLKFQ